MLPLSLRPDDLLDTSPTQYYTTRLMTQRSTELSSTLPRTGAMELFIYRLLHQVPHRTISGFDDEVYTEGEKIANAYSPVVLASTRHNEIMAVLVSSVSLFHPVCFFFSLVYNPPIPPHNSTRLSAAVSIYHLLSFSLRDYFPEY